MSSFHATNDTTMPRSLDLKSVQSFAEFYPFYLTEHRNRTCRALHFVGSSLCLGCLAMLFVSGHFLWLLAAVLSVYSCAWIGHFVFEHNRPATIKRPLYSAMGD